MHLKWLKGSRIMAVTKDNVSTDIEDINTSIFGTLRHSLNNRSLLKGTIAGIAVSYLIWRLPLVGQ
jgi:hypothetical protein